jgi:orotate phosphoribosyltransferase-like protein
VPTQQPPPDRRRERLTASIQRTANELDCSTDTVERLIADGRLRKVQIATRKVAVSWESILDLIEGGATR